MTTPWTKVVEPHENVKNGKVKQGDFAASLADVLQHGGNPDYFDPVRFFDRTFLTAGLRSLAGEVVGRLTGRGDGDAVMQIQTPFGGGKTHTLICLYHLVKNGPACFDHPALKGYWLERGWSVPPAVPVAAFDGNHVGVGDVELAPGVVARTMWGHLAFQLGGAAAFALVAKDDAARTDPGGQTIDDLLNHVGGGLIILDEVVNYIEKAAALSVQDSTLASQTLTFLQALAGRAGAHDRVVVVATLPKSELSSTQVHGQASLSALDRLQAIFGRVQKVREPVQGDEVHEIIRRRLFLDIGKLPKRNETVEAYVADLRDRPEIPEEARQKSYRERFEQSYPFHPFLIDVLNRHVATNPKFQRTRGALRLLALIVADLIKRKHEGLLIQPADINLANEEIRSELMELVDREFRNVLEADIIGDGSNAQSLDRQQAAGLQKWRLASGLATTAFLYTCESGSQSKGASLAELNLAAARPEVDKGTVPGLIAQMKERFHFLNTEGGRYRFTTSPNLNRILLDAKRNIADEDVLERVKTEISNAMAAQPFARYIWVTGGREDVPDSANTKLVVMPLDVGIGPTSTDASKAAVRKLLNKAGDTERVRRNTMLFLLPAEAEVSSLKDRVAALMAAEKVDAARKNYNLSESQKEQLDQSKKENAKGLKLQVLRTYRHVAWGGQTRDEVLLHDMGQPPHDPDKKLTDVVLEFLKQPTRHKYIEALAPVLLSHPTKLKVWPENEDTLSLRALPEYFRNFTHLPILRDEDVLHQAIADGVATGMFALASGTSGTDAKILHYKERIQKQAVSLEDGFLLLRATRADAILEADAEAKRLKDEEDRKKADEERKRRQDDKKPDDQVVVDVVDKKPVVEVKQTTEEVVDDGEDDDGKPVRRLRLDVEVPFSDFSSFYSGVINALGRHADSIQIKVSIQASRETGFGDDVLEDKVKDTLHTLFKSDSALKVEK